MALIEAEKKHSNQADTSVPQGTEGLFAAIEDRGNITYGATNDATAGLSLAEFDTILKEFDKQGAIEEYMMFLNRVEALGVDDMLAGLGNNASGSAYGVFDNDADMALNLASTVSAEVLMTSTRPTGNT